MKPYSTAGNVRYLARLLVRYSRRYPALVVLLLLVRLAMPMLAALLPTAAVAALTRGGGAGWYLGSILLLLLLYAAATFLDGYLDQKMDLLRRGFRTTEAMTLLMEKTLTMDYCLLEPAEGQVRLTAAVNACKSTTSGVQSLIYSAEQWLQGLLGLLIYGAAAVALDWRILPVLMGMTFVSNLITRKGTAYEMRNKPVADQDLYGQHYLHRQAADPANGKDIRLYRMENWFMTALLVRLKRRDAWRQQLFHFRRAKAVSDSVFLVLRDILAYTMLVKAFLTGEMDAAGFTLTIGVLASFTAWLNDFVSAVDDMRYESLEVSDFRRFLEQENVLNHAGTADAAAVRRPPQVELRDVTFTYPGADAPVLDHLNLTVRPGENIALVGLNGAGKTTLVKLLSGLYRPTGGQILVDGVPAEDFPVRDYYKLVGTVYQDVRLLPFTIGENVAGREEYDRERVWRCLDLAGLRETVEVLPRGLDTPLTQKLEPDGVDLSGGQRQRLLFARALYKDAPLLILDEPTAALDPLAEADLYRKYAQAAGDKTSIFISHRLSSTQFCDRVVYLDHGRIAEAGTHRDLLDRDGEYAKLFRLQSSYYRDGKEAPYEAAQAQ